MMKGVTLEQLAKKTPLTKSTISRIERMEVDATLYELIVIADGLEVEYYDLFYVEYE